MPTKSRNRRLARRMKPPRLLSRRKGSGKKGSARARNPKKLRGGVTRKRLSQLTQQELLTALEELPADVVKQIGKRHPLLIPPFTNDTKIRQAESRRPTMVHGGARAFWEDCVGILAARDERHPLALTRAELGALAAQIERL